MAEKDLVFLTVATGRESSLDPMLVSRSLPGSSSWKVLEDSSKSPLPHIVNIKNREGVACKYRKAGNVDV